MRFQILALSGGGYLGLFTAQILAELERQAGVPIAQCFDLIAGTSIGGIIALGLGQEVSTQTIRDSFVTNGSAIFSARKRPKTRAGALWDALKFIAKPKYDGTALRRTCSTLLGEDSLLGASRHRLLIPVINMTTGSVQMLKTAHHPDFVKDHQLRMVDVALATSAAPTYFPLAEINDYLCADGGLAANAPDLCALHEATHFLRQEQHEIHILSIGTTTAGFSISHQTGRDLGAFDWISSGRLFSTMISAQQQLTTYILDHRLGTNYVRIDAVQSPEQQADLGLDVATEQAAKTIAGLADGVLRRISKDPRIGQILSHRAPSPQFYA